MRSPAIPLLWVCLVGTVAQAQNINTIQKRGTPAITLPSGSRICLMPVSVRFELSADPIDVKANIDPTGDLSERTTRAIGSAAKGLATVSIDLSTAAGRTNFAERCPGLDLSAIAPERLAPCLSAMPGELRPSHVLTARVLVKVGVPGRWQFGSYADGRSAAPVPIPFGLPGTSRTLFVAVVQEAQGRAELWRREVQIRDRLDAAERRTPEVLRELFSTITKGDKKP